MVAFVCDGRGALRGQGYGWVACTSRTFNTTGWLSMVRRSVLRGSQMPVFRQSERWCLTLRSCNKTSSRLRRRSPADGFVRPARTQADTWNLTIQYMAWMIDARSSRVRKEGSTPLLVIHATIISSHLISSHLISSPIAQYVMRQYTQRDLRRLDGTSCTYEEARHGC